MASDQSGGAEPSKKEREAGERASRKDLGKDGRPQPAPTREEQNAANRTKMTVATKPEPSPHEIKPAMGEK